MPVVRETVVRLSSAEESLWPASESGVFAIRYEP